MCIVVMDTLAKCLNEAGLAFGKERGNEQKTHKTGAETYIDSPC